MLNRSTEPRHSTSVLEAKPGKLNIKTHSPRLFYYNSLPQGVALTITKVKFNFTIISTYNLCSQHKFFLNMEFTSSGARGKCLAKVIIFHTSMLCM